MTEKIKWIAFDVLESFMIDVLVHSGVPQEDAKLCADNLITADKRGIDSHGINRLKPIYIDRIKDGILNPVSKLDIVKESPTTAVIDGNNGMGHVIGKKAMDMAIQKADEFGMGMIAVRNSSHYGIAGYYALQAIEKNMIGITGSNARPSIAPTFGVENMLGTNPLTFGFPTNDDFPFVIDCATSVTQRGKIELYARENKPMPDGWVINQDGSSGMDANKALNDLIQGSAALTPLGGIGEDMGGYKGYGYATVVEILCSALQSGNYLKMLCGLKEGQKVPYRLGHFFIAVKIENFIEIEEFKKTTSEILHNLRASKIAPGEERIYTPGEKEHLAWLERKERGVPVNESLLKEIKILIEECGLEKYRDLV